MVNYKKIRAKERQQSLATSQTPTNTLKPDFGHYWIENKSAPALTVCLEHPFVMWTPQETYVGFEMDGRCGTIIIDGLTKKESEDISKNGFMASIEASPSERYQSTDQREYIIPFRIVSN